MAKIKIENAVLIVLLALVIIGFIFAASGLYKAPKAPANKETASGAGRQDKAASENRNMPGYNTKNSNSQVSIDLTPNGFSDGKLYIDASFNTHSGDLADYNLKELVGLYVDGKVIQPSSVPKLSWHHGEGTFVFDLDNQPKQFTIKIRGIPEIEERTFSWP